MINEIVTQKILIVKQNSLYVDLVLVLNNEKGDMMDIFSATSKQVETSTAPKVQQQSSVRQVEQSNEATKSVNDNQKDTEKLGKVIDDLNNQMESLETNVTFGFNDKIDSMFVNVMERSTGKIIRKIPTEEAMTLSAKMKEIIGIIFDKKG